MPSTVYLGFSKEWLWHLLPVVGYIIQRQKNENLGNIRRSRTQAKRNKTKLLRCELNKKSSKWNGMWQKKNYVLCVFCIALEADDNNEADDDDGGNSSNISNPMEKNYSNKLFNSNNNGTHSRIFFFIFFIFFVSPICVFVCVSSSPILSMMMMLLLLLSSSLSLIWCAQWNFYVFI